MKLKRTGNINDVTGKPITCIRTQNVIFMFDYSSLLFPFTANLWTMVILR